MPKIIILKTNDQTGTGGQVTLDYLFWLAVKPGREIPLPTFQSAWLGASEEDTAALQGGKIIERAKSRSFPLDLSTPEAKKLAHETAIPGVKRLLEQELAQAQAVEDARLSPLQFYGLAFDGDSWNG